MIDGSIIQSGDRFKRAAFENPEERAEQVLWIKNAIEVFNYAAIDLTDALSVDADVEANGDELDGTAAEDDFIEWGNGGIAGCPVSDPGGCEHDVREVDDGE